MRAKGNGRMGRRDDQPLYDRLWGSGFLPSNHQGVKFRNAGDPVLYLSNPPGTYAANCLLARRLAERDVRFVQLFHMGWDHHGNLPGAIKGQCNDTEQATAGLIKDLKQRGLLDDTLIVWGGEFGRTIYSQGTLTADNYGRDHHLRCFTLFLAGGGVKPGMSLGATDDYCYNVVSDPVSIYDLHATMLRLMGVDHTCFTFKFQGLDAKLTGVEGAQAVEKILA